jgi:hypothetical protein
MLPNPAAGSDRLPESAFRTPVFIGVRSLDGKWAFFPLGRRGQALGEVNDGESGQQCQNQADAQGGYLTV